MSIGLGRLLKKLLRRIALALPSASRKGSRIDGDKWRANLSRAAPTFGFRPSAAAAAAAAELRIVFEWLRLRLGGDDFGWCAGGSTASFASGVGSSKKLFWGGSLTGGEICKGVGWSMTLCGAG